MAARGRRLGVGAARLAAALLLVAILACDSPSVEAPRGDDRVSLIAALPAHAWLADRLVGPEARVDALLGPGDSPETFSPSEEQVSRVARATLFFAAGLPFEEAPWMVALRSAGRPAWVDLSRSLPIEPEDEPHGWLAPVNLMAQARTMAAHLRGATPALAGLVGERLPLLLDDLAELDRRLGRRLAPCRGGTLVAYHPAWTSFAAAYGLEQLSVEAEGKAPSDAELTRLIRRVQAGGHDRIVVGRAHAAGPARAMARMLHLDLLVADPLDPDPPALLDALAEGLAASRTCRGERRAA